eukprot:TRINITY_DN4378_c0_g1_i1.p1 TRINITY_DN4378_c0_g1~~TRINITY_DN4378_c0_g1_i1.p1  ORF type:complete len:110 (-),score=15.41 TRINITY_DN4378_c0_g1_i1:1072-1401(-)
MRCSAADAGLSSADSGDESQSESADLPQELRHSRAEHGSRGAEGSMPAFATGQYASQLYMGGPPQPQHHCSAAAPNCAGLKRFTGCDGRRCLPWDAPVSAECALGQMYS